MTTDIYIHIYIHNMYTTGFGLSNSVFLKTLLPKHLVKITSYVCQRHAQVSEHYAILQPSDSAKAARCVFPSLSIQNFFQKAQGFRLRLLKVNYDGKLSLQNLMLHTGLGFCWIDTWSLATAMTMIF